MPATTRPVINISGEVAAPDKAEPSSKMKKNTKKLFYSTTQLARGSLRLNHEK
jgi:hypothetical protein